MTLVEQYATLILAERITRGESFNEGMTIEIRQGQAVRVTAAMVEQAARIALERHEKGFADTQPQESKKEEAKKP